MDFFHEGLYQLLRVEVRCDSPSDVTGRRTFLSELRNLNQLFFGRGADFYGYLAKYSSVLDAVKSIFFSETCCMRCTGDRFSANYPFNDESQSAFILS